VTRLLARAAVAIAVLLVALALLFPTDAVVRRLLARNTPAGMPTPAFESSRLGPTGLTLSKVTLARPTGPVVVAADRVTLHPSLLGLLAGRGGHPWTFDADLCGGTAKGTLAAEGPALVTDADFDNADLGTCPLIEFGGAALAGHARGTIHLRLEPVTPAHGNGQLELTDVTWKGQGLVALFRVSTASGNWRVEERKLTLASLDVHLAASFIRGAGEVVLADALPDSELRLALTMVPADGSSPPQPVLIGGTLGHPQLVGAER
jgi:type II secretion system protein N